MKPQKVDNNKPVESNKPLKPIMDGATANVPTDARTTPVTDRSSTQGEPRALVLPIRLGRLGCLHLNSLYALRGNSCSPLQPYRSSTPLATLQISSQWSEDVFGVCAIWSILRQPGSTKVTLMAVSTSNMPWVAQRYGTTRLERWWVWRAPPRAAFHSNNATWLPVRIFHMIVLVRSGEYIWVYYVWVIVGMSISNPILNSPIRSVCCHLSHAALLVGICLPISNHPISIT